MQLKSLFITAILILALPAAAQPDVHAQLQPTSQTKERAFEIALSGGYVGALSEGKPGLADVSSGGSEIMLHLNCRATGNLLIGAYGGGSNYVAQSNLPNGNIWSAAAGLEANWYSLPGNDFDPRVGFGGGSRADWMLRPTGVDARKGLDFSRVNVGRDLRVSPLFSFGPYLGMSGTVFVAQTLTPDASTAPVNVPNTIVSLNGGFLGRFDLFSRRGTTLVTSNK